MDQGRKKNIKRAIAFGCALAVVLLLAAMPLLAKQDVEDDGPQASILSGTVAAGSINTELVGGGTLVEEERVSVSVLSEVKLKKFLVSNGDRVTEGTPIATVDRVTVMTAISQIQETLEYLSEQIEDARETDSDEKVTALAGGTVKILYAREGDSVQNVMLEHGALAVLSLDGLMAVDLETDAALSAGSAVTVTLSDGTAVSGEVVRNLAGEMTVTVEDDGYAVGDGVQVTAEDGTSVGSGALYIYSPWNATAYAGTVSSVKVSEGDKLSAGKTLMVLTDVGYSASYRQLIGQRQEYEDMMLELFKMYQTETVTAPCDGVVSGIDTDSLQLLQDWGTGYVLSFLTNAPNGDDATVYSNYIGQVTTVASNGWVVNVNPQSVPIDDYLDLSGVELDTALMTQTVLHTQTEIPVFTLTEGAWVQVDRATVGSGDILLFAADPQGGLVWSVLVEKGAAQPGGSETPPASGMPGSSGGTAAQPGFSGGSFGGMGGMAEPEPEFELYELDTVEIAAVTAQDTVMLEITVDEQDVKALQVGMTAQIKINALGGEKYTATVTEIGNTGTSNGGSSKYTVTLTMDRAENMLSGMNATATIILTSTGNVLTVPAAALVEQGGRTVVYTGYDEETGALLNPVAVETGVSDGETVEILQGLTEGQTYYYAYYDTLYISDTPDFGGGLFG